jgi:hypothetical protein
MRAAVVALLALVALAPMASRGSAAAVQKAVPRERERAVPRRETAVPFKVGETLTFDVSWSSYLVAGTAVASVRERRAGPDSTSYYIVAEGRPLPLIARLYSLYYKMDTLVDTATLLPQQMTLYSEEGRRQRLGTTRFDRAARRAFFELSGDTSFKTDMNVPTQVQDGLSALYSIRASAISPGTTLKYPIIDDGSIYQVQMEASSPERVKVPLGDMTAWKLGVRITDSQGQAVGQNIGVWISNDTRKLPVKLQADLPVGNFVLALREAR